MYSRIRFAAELAPTDDYANARLVAPPELLTQPTLKIDVEGLPVPTTGVTVDLGGFTTISSMLIVNRSTTAAQVIDATWFHQKYTEPGTIDIAQAATGDTITDNGASFASFVTSGAAAGDFVRVVDAATAANNAAWAIRGVAADVLTLVAEATLTAAVADAVTLHLERRNTQGCAPGGWIFVTDNVQPLGDLVLTSESGTPLIDLYILGT